MKKFLRALAIAGILSATVLVIAVASQPSSKDYISYWSAGQLLKEGANPYSYSQVLGVEKAQGYVPAAPIIMRNPPWALFLVAPLGWASARIGFIFWIAAMIGCIMASLHLLGVAPRDRIFVYCFAPVLGCLASGQSSSFLLLGFSLFLYFHRRMPFIAGTALLLMAIKPHLFLVFWPLLLVDCLYRKNFRLLAGSIVALIAATGFAMHLDSHIWPQYFAMLRASRLETEFLQTPSYLLRYLISSNKVWLQFIPSLLATGWGAWFYWRNRSIWDWRVHGMPLMLVTLFVSPYAWMTDEIVLLPAIMFALANTNRPKYSTALFMMISGIAMAMLMAQIQLSSGAYLWTSSAWLAWYFYSCPQKTTMPERLTAASLCAS